MFFSKIGKKPSISSASKDVSTISKPPSVKIKTVKVKKPAENPLGLNSASSSYSVTKKPKGTSSSGSSQINSRYTSPVSRPMSRNGSVTPRPRTTSNSTRNGSVNSNDSSLPSDFEDEDNDDIYDTPKSNSSVTSKPKSRKKSQNGNSAKALESSKSSRSSSKYDDDEYDDSSWQQNFDKYSGNSGAGSTARNSVDPSDDATSDVSMGDVKETPNNAYSFYRGNIKAVKVIEAKSLMQFAEYTPLFRGKKNFEYNLSMPCTPFRER